MTSSRDEVRPITSVAELMAVGVAMADQAATRYAAYAAACAAAGNAEAAGVLQRLGAPASAAGRPAWSAGRPRCRRQPSAMPDELADEDPYTVTAYRVLSIAVRDADRRPSPSTPMSRRMRRTRSCSGSPKVWRTSSSGMPPHCGGSAARLGDGRRAAASRSPPPRRAWRSCGHSPGVARATWRPAMPRWPTRRRRSAIPRAPRCCAASRPRPPGCFRRETHPALAGRAGTPAATGAFELLHTALVDLEDAYALYLRAAEGRAGEEAMLDAQRWAASALRRSGLIRGRLTALGRAARP